MFERYAPNAPAAPGFSRGDKRGQERRALRAFGWSELTARIDAARDLRRVLRNDALVEASSFADAAGGYFVSEGNSKRRVNPNALEASKGFAAIPVAANAETPNADQSSGDRES